MTTERCCANCGVDISHRRLNAVFCDDRRCVQRFHDRRRGDPTRPLSPALAARAERAGRCRECGEDMPLRGHAAICQECHNRLERERHQADIEASRARRRARANRARFARQPMLDKIKMDSGCVDCGYDAHPVALHFDHIDPATKLFNIGNAWGYSWEQILAEIEKCEVRCANCHAIRSVEQGHIGRGRRSRYVTPSEEVGGIAGEDVVGV